MHFTGQWPGIHRHDQAACRSAGMDACWSLAFAGAVVTRRAEIEDPFGGEGPLLVSLPVAAVTGHPPGGGPGRNTRNWSSIVEVSQ